MVISAEYILHDCTQKKQQMIHRKTHEEEWAAEKPSQVSQLPKFCPKSEIGF